MAGTPTTAVARNYSWPPFESDNTAAQRHGAYSPRKVDPLAVEILEAVRRHVTWWHPADEPSIWAWVRLEARVQLLTEYLAERGGDVDDQGSVRPAADLLTKLEVRAESMRSRLGLDPLSRARLGRDVAAQSLDLARFWASQQAEDAAKEARTPSEAAEGGIARPGPAQRPENDDAAA